MIELGRDSILLMSFVIGFTIGYRWAYTKVTIMINKGESNNEPTSKETRT